MVKRKRCFFIICLILASSFLVIPPASAAKNTSIYCTDLNYHYAIDFIGNITDFSGRDSKDTTGINASPKILIELSIESIYGGFDWIPMNPLITDNDNHIFRDFKVIVAPPAGEKNISVKYIVTPTYRDSKSLTFFEEGVSDDGKKAYRVFLRNLPLVYSEGQ